MERVVAPMQGTVVLISVKPGDRVAAGQQLVVLESMKMEHVVAATTDGQVGQISVTAGETVKRDQVLVTIQPGAPAAAPQAVEETAEDGIRADLAEVLARKAAGQDANRPEAVERRHREGRRTARENVEDLCDPGTFVEYGALVVAAQRQRRSMAELVAKTPADGMVAGIAEIGGRESVVVAYDATVLAGTQGFYNHAKKDRMFELAARRELPVVLFAEGGGGRPGDTDVPLVAMLEAPAFSLFARLSGLVPLVGVVAGRCFAGNAALLGCCDVIIGTAGATIGMGGPAMIEGGGLGVVAPEDVGPMSVQVPNGVVDIAVADEAEAVQVAKKYLSYFSGPAGDWSTMDQERLRNAVPENRVRAYDVRAVIELVADTDSVLELRPRFGEGIVTALVRVEGRPMGLIANNPGHLGGAIDRDAADKAARFMQLCDSHGLPIVSLCDTPGFMVGPESEKTATVRHFSRLFVTGANLTVPLCSIVLRKAYGLGAMAMFGGGSKIPYATVAWPTAEFGPMGLEGAIRLGFRRELDAITDPVRRKETLENMIAMAYERGKALNAASMFEVDDVIDPSGTRRWITAVLPKEVARANRPHVDTW
ncbi:carboxyl transferase domain-containing protein [Kibdelosporangium persicum]|uniref:Acetyl-CoA carboxylase carboxyltransferase component n=1 Tax=Kibdelosporangium persicum TaxID=2698649 RepID=A0ABX2F7L0_9PSEU|nr:carboxyl transferase domain-containing protein [Kibdelosporangium persicum]NRN67345.1 Acetyl-CoA carboxylase carboxyltransferase component [Kibdelosporangium persicum]